MVRNSVADLSVVCVDYWREHEPRRDPVFAALAGGDADGSGPVRSADIVLFSVFGDDHVRARHTAVAFSAEARVPASGPQWTIDRRFRPEPAHLRLAPWAYQLLADGVPVACEADLDRRSRFCNFIYSNPRCELRNAFFEMLHRRESVDALGHVAQNRSDDRLSPRVADDFRRSKIEVMRDHRFTIAFENEEALGYTTEKLIDAWLAGSVPIYWGDPAHGLDLPAAGCLSLYEAGSLSRLVEQVLEAHHDSARYAELQAANPFRNGTAEQVLATYRASLAAFAAQVREDAVEHRGRRRRSRLRIAHDAAEATSRRLVRRVASKIGG